MKYMPKKCNSKRLSSSKTYLCPCSFRDFKVKLVAKDVYLGGSKLRVNTTFRREDDPLEISQMLYILMIR